MKLCLLVETLSSIILCGHMTGQIQRYPATVFQMEGLVGHLERSDQSFLWPNELKSFSYTSHTHSQTQQLKEHSSHCLKSTFKSNWTQIALSPCPILHCDSWVCSLVCSAKLFFNQVTGFPSCILSYESLFFWGKMVVFLPSNLFPTVCVCVCASVMSKSDGTGNTHTYTQQCALKMCCRLSDYNNILLDAYVYF